MLKDPGKGMDKARAKDARLKEWKRKHLKKAREEQRQERISDALGGATSDSPSVQG